MSPILREYVLKGLYLGLWAYFAIVQNPGAVDWPRFSRTIGWMSGGLIIGLAIGAFVQIRRGYMPLANLKAFPLVVLLDSPFWIYLGILGGLGFGLAHEYDPPAERDWLGWCALIGSFLGYGFFQLQSVKDRATRFLTALLVGGLLIYLGVNYLLEIPDFNTVSHREVLGIVILAGLPFFYMLTFCGEAEESEVEIAALCAGLGIGLYQVFAGTTSLFGDKFVMLVPLLIYFLYVTKWMPFLKVFKHTLRGYSAMNLNRPVEALTSFKRALALDPSDDLATGGMWELHQRVDVASLPSDSPLLSHLDYGFCLNQATALLIGLRAPAASEREKADRMLTLVETQKPALLARIDYLRAISKTHAKQFDDAASTLSHLLDPEVPYDVTVRNEVLFDAWNLALRIHPELTERLGEAELSRPGRRMQAIAAVERLLAVEPANETALEQKAFLYSGLKEAEFVADAASGAPPEFNYDYAEQLGLAFIEGGKQVERGMGFLRIAGRGAGVRGPIIFTRLAELADQLGQVDAARGYREQVKRAGLQIGVKSLSGEQRSLYFATLKKLATDAEARGDYETAIDDYRLYLEIGSGELEGYRKLADLYEKKKDPLNALLMVETGLVYSGKDKDLLERKDKYYYSVDVDRLKAVRDKVFRFFDVEYCASKSRQVLDSHADNLESLDWALHLARLGKVIKPDSVPLRFTEARILLRKGERDSALTLLEDIRDEKPGGDEWYQALKVLGDLYLNELERPDLAKDCFLAYREYSKSGADTLFNIARCYEALNQPANAIRFYEAVTGYDQHPKYWEAREAVERLKG